MAELKSSRECSTCGLLPAFLTKLLDERDKIYTDRFTALEKLVNERDRLYDTRFRAAESAVASALAAQEKASAATFQASEKAILKSEQAQKDYNERSNEFRGQLDDQAKNLLPRAEADNRFKAQEDKTTVGQTALANRIDAAILSARNELLAFQSAYENSHKSLQAEVVALREARSQFTGVESARQRDRLQNNWAIGVVIGGMVGAIEIMLHFLK